MPPSPALRPLRQPSQPPISPSTRHKRDAAADAIMAEQLQTLTLARPDDWHHHLRDGAALATTVPFAARTYGRAICMPNLVPPVTTAALAVAYKERIMKHVPKGSSFEPLMTLYLTDSTTAQDIKDAKASGVVVACKLYPKGATTNSHGGVTDIKKIWKTLDAMEEHGLLLLVHGVIDWLREGMSLRAGTVLPRIDVQAPRFI